MTNITRNKRQCMIRLFKSDWDLIRAKTRKEGITYQKLMEVLIKAYLKDDPNIMKLVQKYADDKENKKKRYGITELESDDIMSSIEKFNPLSEVETILKEIKENE